LIRDRRRSAAPADDGVQFTHDAQARQRGVGDQRQALPRVVIDHGQHPEATAFGEGIGDEVEAPSGVGAIRNEHGPTCAQRPLAAAAPAHLQLLFPVEGSQLLLVHHDALPAQHDVDPPVAEPSALRRYRLHRLA